MRSQSDPEWRLVVVDDVYPDEAPGRWLQDLGDPRITYVRNSENLRPSRNYNRCIELMQGEFAVLMGCDDVMRPNYVARVKELITSHPDAARCYAIGRRLERQIPFLDEGYTWQRPSLARRLPSSIDAGWLRRIDPRTGLEQQRIPGPIVGGCEHTAW